MMKLFGLGRRREKRAATIENPTVKVSSENFLEFFGLSGGGVPHVTIETALKVPAVQAAVLFLSRTLATVPLQVFKRDESGPKRLSGKLQTILEENPNDEMDTSKLRRYLWEQVFTGGRGLLWIERSGSAVEALWPMDPTQVSVRREGLKLFYFFDGRRYPASDVIDIPFMLKPNGVQHRGPIALGERAIQLALSMNDYGSNFFAGGGIPPLAVEGPMPANAETMRRAIDDIKRAIDVARESGKPMFQMPPGYKISQIGFDPEKGQMTEARLFQVQEIARVYQMPPNFLQDLSRATFSNVEQNDLHLVKHLVAQWCTALEGELNLKLFGRMNGKRFVRHDLDGLLRGDFKSLMEGLVRGVQGSVHTPNEAREQRGLPKVNDAAADLLHIQGATVPLGTSAGKDQNLSSENEGDNDGEA
ncbi:Phage portal protein [Labrenzia sp. THAF82]|uniref:phage portal protein n=1 Tax=Labrenzia sp. THAF82 TaxID=2587861 RepID=UPI0012A8ACBD|nr:phage portal protein [Labrenzia sp. THAF82]QFT31806.1 Phage portal protein [Labrenzia sp. THAF82]